jgi:hypothetical protein
MVNQILLKHLPFDYCSMKKNHLLSRGYRRLDTRAGLRSATDSSIFSVRSGRKV